MPHPARPAAAATGMNNVLPTSSCPPLCHATLACHFRPPSLPELAAPRHTWCAACRGLFFRACQCRRAIPPQGGSPRMRPSMVSLMCGSTLPAPTGR